jgi:hypothetical protein
MQTPAEPYGSRDRPPPDSAVNRDHGPVDDGLVVCGQALVLSRDPGYPEFARLVLDGRGVEVCWSG